MNFKPIENPESGGFVNKFIEAPSITEGWLQDFKIVQSSNGNPKIAFTVVEKAVTEGLNLPDIGNHRIANDYFVLSSEKTWDILNRFLSGVSENLGFPEKYQNAITRFESAYNEGGNQKLAEAVRDFCNAVIAKKEGFWVITGTAGYKTTESGNTYRSVYPGVNKFGPVVRNAENVEEIRDYFEKNQKSLLKDEGEPTTTTPNTSSNASMSDAPDISNEGDVDDQW